ncbi:MAG: YaeQ family protein [Proteobacteria bacterium]|nr:YaeQ family protein [Pseudomonadota bacterium]
MALKPTIYKLNITLADIEQDHYDTLNLTMAQHPSETLERMMARVLAFCMNARDPLSFTKGLSEAQEPDIWARTLEGQLSLWIDMGEPAVDRIKKATRLSPRVKVYSFNLKSDTWWAQGKTKFNELPVSVVQFQWAGIQALAKLVKRTMDISVTLSGETAYVGTENGECEVPWVPLQTNLSTHKTG